MPTVAMQTALGHRVPRGLRRVSRLANTVPTIRAGVRSREKTLSHTGNCAGNSLTRSLASIKDHKRAR
jgi:hypothetical protein